MPAQLLPTSGRAQIPGFPNSGSQVFQEQGYLLLHIQNNFHFDTAEQLSVHVYLLRNPGMGSEYPGSRNSMCLERLRDQNVGGQQGEEGKDSSICFSQSQRRGFVGPRAWNGLRTGEDPPSQKLLCIFGSFFKISIKSVQNWLQKSQSQLQGQKADDWKENPAFLKDWPQRK